MTFDEKVEALVEKLGEDIAAAASDGDEFANGLMNAAILLLDQGSVSEVVIEELEEEDLDEFDPLDEDDDDDEVWFGSSSLFDEDDEEDDEDDSLWDSEDEDEFRRQSDGLIQ